MTLAGLLEPAPLLASLWEHLAQGGPQKPPTVAPSPVGETVARIPAALASARRSAPIARTPGTPRQRYEFLAAVRADSDYYEQAQLRPPPAGCSLWIPVRPYT